MPIQQCTIDGQTGYRWGTQGRCYVGKGARAKAIRQARAIKASQARNKRRITRAEADGLLTHATHAHALGANLGAFTGTLGTNAASRSPRNALKVDPTRTTTLRRVFAQQMRRRFDALAKDVRMLLVDEDVFGLTTNEAMIVNQRWRFLSDAEKVRQFRLWLASRIAGTVLARKQGPQGKIEPWLADAVREAYTKGLGHAFDAVKHPELAQSLDFYKGTRKQFLEDSFNRPVSVNKIELMYGRAFDDLDGITTQMSAQMSRELTQGFIQGKGPREIARDVNKAVGIGKKRAEVISRTEVIRAHSEGNLDALEELGVEEIGVAVEWSTTGDDRVCKLCAPLQGVILKTKEAHGMFPRHANCRCSPTPANVGEDKRGQLRTKTKIQAAITKSLKAERPKRGKRSVETQRRRSTWAGANKTIAAKRPKSILD